MDYDGLPRLKESSSQCLPTLETQAKIDNYYNEGTKKMKIEDHE